MRLGGLGIKQRQWLRKRLQMHHLRNERVIVAGHCPVHPLAVNNLDSLVWDYQEVLSLMAECPACVAYLAGHDHEGGYCHDKKSKIHHLTVPAILQAVPGTNRFLTIDLRADAKELIVRGEGTCRVEPGFWLKSKERFQRYRDVNQEIDEQHLNFAGDGIILELRTP